MYAIEKELKILRQFISPKHMEGLKRWKCYSEDEILAAEKRLHVKLPFPIRDIYRHMADLLVTSGYLRPLELLHWEGRYLGFFLAPGEGDIIGEKRVPLPVICTHGKKMIQKTWPGNMRMNWQMPVRRGMRRESERLWQLTRNTGKSGIFL